MSQGSETTRPVGERSGEPALLRKLNVSAALKAFLADEQLSVSQLRSAIGVSRPTAEDVLSGLLRDHLVEEVPAAQATTTPGRPARQYRLATSNRYVIGIDIGANSVGCVVTDFRGRTVESFRHSVRAADGPHARLRRAADLMSDAIQRGGLTASQVAGVGCGITGVVRDEGRPVAVPNVPTEPGLHSYSLPGFSDIDIADACRQAFQTDALIANDIKLSALAEHGHGAAAEVEDVVYMHAGRRLGSSLIVGGHVMQGRHGLAGEIGSMRMLGWAEAMETWVDALARFRPVGSRSDGARELFAAAAGGDAAASAAVDTVARALALGASALSHAVDPQLVVLGGGLSRAGDVLADPFRRHLDETMYITPPVAISHLGDESVALGAAHLALRKAQDRMVAV